jgi:pyrroline-5-carboxylate reductase
MATALALGWIRAGFFKPSQIVGSSRTERSRKKFEQGTGSKTSHDNAKIARTSDLLVLSVKPKFLADAKDSIRESLKPEALIVSVVAGVPISKIAEGLGDKRAIVRVMPNTPCLVGQGVSGIAFGPHVSDGFQQLIYQLFSSVGMANVVPENLIDAVNGISGCGPAYAFLMIEALADGAVKMGIARDMAISMAAQTLLGASKMVLETQQHPAALKDAVCSPAGTTIAGIHELEKAGVRAALMNAVQAATHRAHELGKQ